MEEWEKAQVIISSFLRMYSRVLYKEQLIQNEDSQHLSHTNGTGVFAPGGGGGGVLGLIFVGYLPLASECPYPIFFIIVCSVANYRPYLSYFWSNM